jgi:hypothetical protein
MFIDRIQTHQPTPFEGAEPISSSEALVEFRSFERSRRGFGSSIYKHLTLNGVETLPRRFKTDWLRRETGCRVERDAAG